MNRVLSPAFAAVVVLLAAPAFAQPHSQPESPAFFGGFSLGVSLGYTSLAEETGYVDPDEDTADAIGASGALQLGGVLTAFGDSLRTELSLGYRGSFDHFLIGLVDTGTIHRHELSVGLHVRRAVSISFGGGVALLHDEGQTLPAATFHLDTRYVTRSGVTFAVPLNLSYFPGAGGESVIMAQTGLEIGWQSLHR